MKNTIIINDLLHKVAGIKEMPSGAFNIRVNGKSIAKGNTHIPEPSFLAVITGDQIAKVRKDGVMVIPIGALR